MRWNPLFLFRKTELRLPQCNALHQERHVAGKRAHGLQAFAILERLARRAAMHAVPVLAGGNRHAGNGEILVKFIKGGGKPAAPCHSNRCADLHRLVKGRAEEEAVQKCYQRSVGRSIVNGRADHETVAGFKHRCSFINRVLKNAFSGFAARIAGNAASYSLIANVEAMRFNALFFKNLFPFTGP